MTERTCIHCFKHEGNKTPYCADNPGRGCTYGLGHEYVEEGKLKQEKKVEKTLCVKCGLHAKNPASAASACAHEFP